MLKSTGKIKSTPLKKFRIQKKKYIKKQRAKPASTTVNCHMDRICGQITDLQGKLLREATPEI